jgi:hypothetical protein
MDSREQIAQSASRAGATLSNRGTEPAPRQRHERGGNGCDRSRRVALCSATTAKDAAQGKMAACFPAETADRQLKKRQKNTVRPPQKLHKESH